VIGELLVSLLYFISAVFEGHLIVDLIITVDAHFSCPEHKGVLILIANPAPGINVSLGSQHFPLA